MPQTQTRGGGLQLSSAGTGHVERKQYLYHSLRSLGGYNNVPLPSSCSIRSWSSMSSLCHILDYVESVSFVFVVLCRATASTWTVMICTGHFICY